MAAGSLAYLQILHFLPLYLTATIFCLRLRRAAYNFNFSARSVYVLFSILCGIHIVYTNEKWESQYDVKKRRKGKKGKLSRRSASKNAPASTTSWFLIYLSSRHFITSTTGLDMNGSSNPTQDLLLKQIRYLRMLHPWSRL